MDKNILENYPGLMEPSQHPLARVHMDMYSSSVTSTEGPWSSEEYNNTLIFTDSHGEFSWQFGIKTKDKTLTMAKRWFAEIADLGAKYPLLVVVRNNSGENT